MGMAPTAGAETRSQERLDAVFRALAHPARRSLLARLARGPAMVTELAEPFAMSLPAVSKHLRVLEEARLLVRAVDGRVHRCTLSPGPLGEAERWIDDYRAFWEHTLDALGRYLEETSERPPRRTRKKPRS